MNGLVGKTLGQYPITYWDKTITGGGAGAQRPVWSPDSQRIAFEYRPESALEIFTIQADGSQLAYAPNREGIWILSIEQPLDTAQIDPEGTMPAWSP